MNSSVPAQKGTKAPLKAILLIALLVVAWSWGRYGARQKQEVVADRPEGAESGPAVAVSATTPADLPLSRPADVDSVGPDGNGNEETTVTVRFVPPERDRLVPVSEDGFLQRIEDSPPAFAEAPGAKAETVEAVRAAFAEWRAAGQTDDAGATLRLALGAFPREEMLAAAASLMRLGSDQDRMDALWAVAGEFGASADAEVAVRANAPEFPDMSADPHNPDALTPEEERQAAETHAIAAIVSAGFEDASDSVRAYALETISSLPRELSDVLHGQLLCSDSPLSADIRHALMDQLDGASDQESINLFVQAMQSPDDDIAASARRNLESIAGKPLPTILDALQWLEPEENP